MSQHTTERIGHVRRFTETDVPDQSGRTALVTGATGGLGLQVATVLARRGARVLLGSRNPQRGASALARVGADATHAQPELVELDLASLKSVATAITDVRRRTGDRLDLLINNGGIMAPPLSFSTDGIESQWATNVIGPDLLTWGLLPALTGVPGSRVVFVSSTRHASAQFDESRIRADIRGEGYRGFDYYGRTKLADLLLSHELERHFREAGAQTMSVAAHPGFTATGIVGSGFAGLPRILRPIANWGSDVLGQPVGMGALPILYAATAPDVSGDDYIGPRGLGGLRGYPARARRSRASTDTTLGRTLVRVLGEFGGPVSGV
jgi:NAD(P)-dependent dehydrogenase (short-subunit alcohol dehydrogenase family)